MICTDETNAKCLNYQLQFSQCEHVNKLILHVIAHKTVNKICQALFWQR